MRAAVPKPIARSNLRQAAGKSYFIARRWLSWKFGNTRFARERRKDSLAQIHAAHATPLLRQLKDVDMWLQRNKVDSLKVAVSCLDGIVVKPGETFSFWRLVGKPSPRRGFKTGMVLRNGAVGHGVGGGLCQLTNLIYWMTLHTDLTVTERWRHGFDVFPDADRKQPFGSGATCSYNYIDLQIENRTSHEYQLRLAVGETHLEGWWRANIPQLIAFEIMERDHEIRAEWWGGYSRHNRLFRLRRDAATGQQIEEEFVTENHAIMMYQPLLPGEVG